MVCSLRVSHTSSLQGSNLEWIRTSSQIGKEVSALFIQEVENQWNCTVGRVRHLDLELKENTEIKIVISESVVKALDLNEIIYEKVQCETKTKKKC